MKIRTDFVTNSSSTSYICEISGYQEAGYDISPSDVGMTRCDYGHIFLPEYKLNPTDKDIIKHNLYLIIDSKCKSWLRL